MAKTLSSNKFTPMDVYRALTMLWIRIEDMYPDVTKRMLEYWIEHACLFWDGSADIDLGLPASMIKLMGMGKAIALDEIESWDRFTKQDKDLFMAINTVVARGEYWVWCPHSTTTLSLSSCPASCAGPSPSSRPMS